MPEDPIQDLWSKGKEAEVSLTHEELVRLLRPEVGRLRSLFPMHLWIFVVFLAAVLVVDVANLVGYWRNPTLRAVQAAVTLLTLAFLVYTGFVLREARGLERLDDDLVSIVRRRLRFFQTRYGVWLWLAAASVSLASWAVSTFVDNVGGEYPINRPEIVVATLLGQIVLVYAALRLTHWPFLVESRAVLHDLQTQVLDETTALPERRARWKRGQLVWIVVGVILLLLGTFLALRPGWP
jgi:hypothetical protein